MGRIHKLSDLLANRIAAGEVVERPASVVKELVENSLDAEALSIEIAIEQGGRKLIRITDDGIGMDADDLQLCVQRHATSKIENEDDLFRIRTMGFRGEALPSIASVSQFRMISRPRGSDEAFEICIEGDQLESARASSGATGTTVEVRELFFNVPARQKFLRTPQTEIGHITEQLARIALVQPEIEFRLTHNDREVHHLRSAEGMRPRIGDFYGKEMAQSLLEVHREERGLRLHGYVAPPADSRSSAKWQYVFLNGRFVRDRFVAHAVREAYRGLIEAHRFPVVFLSLEVDPSAVDVNVHPTKSEVRWRDSNLLYSQVLSALRDRFLNADLTPQWKRRRDEQKAESGDDQTTAEAETETSADNADAERRRSRIRSSIADFFKQNKPSVGGPTPASVGNAPGIARPPVPNANAPFRPLPNAARFSMPVVPQPDASGESDTRLGTDNGDLPDDLGSILQVHRTYLLSETPDGLIIVDQHALHERILFEQFARQITDGPFESQRMLIPETLDVSADHMSVLEDHAETIALLGFELTPYGPGTIAVHAAPTLLKPERVNDFLRDMLDRLAVRSGPASGEMLINDLLSMMACKAAVKAGDLLSDQEMQALMARRADVERSSNCPHGRPTSVRLTVRDLEKQFKRT